jgi:hypothetical protein
VPNSFVIVFSPELENSLGMMMIKKISAVFLLGLLTSGAAHAALSVNALGGLNFDKNSYDGTTTTHSGKAAFTLGATIEFGGPFLSFETGLFSVGKKEEQTRATGAVSNWSYRGWLIPALVRFTALPVLSVGGGLYFAKFSDKVEVSDSALGIPPNGEYTLASQNHGTTDFGLRVDARAALPLAPLMSFLVDVYYDWGLKDLDTSAASKKTRNYGVLAGVSFGL